MSLNAGLMTSPSGSIANPIQLRRSPNRLFHHHHIQHDTTTPRDICYLFTVMEIMRKQYSITFTNNNGNILHNPS